MDETEFSPTSPLRLDGRVAIVTGASRGIGCASAVRILEAGGSVVLNARAESDEARAAFEDLASRYPERTSIVYGSVANSATVKAIGQHVASKYKRLDILVNNAGILRDNLIGMIPDAEIDEILATNVSGLVKMTQLAARLMTRRKSGSIINLASIVGRNGNRGQLVYSASKAAVIGATYSASKELASQGVRVNAVAPGLIETAMIEAIPGKMRATLEGAIGLGRVGRPEDVANAVLFLASDLSDYITGQVIGVDGGLVI